MFHIFLFVSSLLLLAASYFKPEMGFLQAIGGSLLFGALITAIIKW